MFQLAFQQISHRFDAAVRVPGEAGNVIARVQRVKPIQHEEGVKVVHGARSQHSLQAHAGAVHRGMPAHYLCKFS